MKKESPDIIDITHPDLKEKIKVKCLKSSSEIYGEKLLDEIFWGIYAPLNEDRETILSRFSSLSLPERTVIVVCDDTSGTSDPFEISRIEDIENLGSVTFIDIETPDCRFGYIDEDEEKGLHYLSHVANHPLADQVFTIFSEQIESVNSKEISVLNQDLSN